MNHFSSSSTESLNISNINDTQEIIVNNGADILESNNIGENNDLDNTVSEDVSTSETDPPLRPPRSKKIKKLEKLRLENNNHFSEDSHQNDILFRTDSSVKLNKIQSDSLKGGRNLKCYKYFIRQFQETSRC